MQPSTKEKLRIESLESLVALTMRPPAATPIELGFCNTVHLQEIWSRSLPGTVCNLLPEAGLLPAHSRWIRLHIQLCIYTDVNLKYVNRDTRALCETVGNV